MIVNNIDVYKDGGTIKVELSPDEYRTLVNAIDDKIYNLTTVIDRTIKRNNFVWIEQVNILKNIKDRLKDNSYHLLPGDTIRK